MATIGRAPAADAADAPELPPAAVPAWRGPAILGIGAALGAVVVSLGDPNTTHIPLCPLKALTGWDCAFCGSLRATHSLAHGDLRGALDHNIVFTLGLPLGIAAWAIWMLRSLGHPVLPKLQITRPVFLTLITLAVAFAVIRNLPAFAWLAST